MHGKPDDYDPPLFDAKLIAHRSLNPAGFKIFMLATCGASAAVSVPFYLMGAWPIVGFFGLDVAAIYFAFRMNFRAARAYEHIHLTYYQLHIARVSATGFRREWRFSPAWVRLERVDDEDYGPQRLTLHCRDQRWDIARFLGPDQKAEFAGEFTRALAEARRGRRYS